MTVTTAAKKPTIELRNIKHAAFASEETHCYTATLYVDGERWGEVGNDGHGGCDHFHPVKGKSWGDLKALNEHIAATYPKITGYGMELDENLETVCGGLVNDWLTECDYKRLAARKVLFVKPGEKGLYTFSLKGGMKPAQALPILRAKHPSYVFLADLPHAEALRLYSSETN